MFDLSRSPYPQGQSDKDAFDTWLKQGLQQQFRRIDAVPAELLALIDAAHVLDERPMAGMTAT